MGKKQPQNGKNNSKSNAANQVIYESPIMLPELVNISGNDTHLILRFGYKKHEKSFVIRSSIALTYEQTKEFIDQLQEAVFIYENEKLSS